MRQEAEINCGTHMFDEEQFALQLDTASPNPSIEYPAMSLGRARFLYDATNPDAIKADPKVKIRVTNGIDRKNILGEKLFDTGGFKLTQWTGAQFGTLHHWHLDLFPLMDTTTSTILEGTASVAAGYKDEFAEHVVDLFPECAFMKDEEFEFLLSNNTRLTLDPFGDGSIVDASEQKLPMDGLYDPTRDMYVLEQSIEPEDLFAAAHADGLLENFPNISIRSGVELASLDFRKLQSAIQQVITRDGFVERDLRTIINPYLKIRL